MVTTRAISRDGGVSIAEEKKDDGGEYSFTDDNHSVHDSSLQKDSTTYATTNNVKPKAKKSPFLLLLCATGITSCYLWYGTIQEHVFHMDNAEESGEDNESITLFLLATGTFSSFLLAWVWTIVGPILLSTTSKKDSSVDANQTTDAGGRLNLH